jgi:hypothetical protein
MRTQLSQADFEEMAADWVIKTFQKADFTSVEIKDGEVFVNTGEAPKAVSLGEAQRENATYE